MIKHYLHDIPYFLKLEPGRVGHLTRKSDTRSGNILSFLLPLFQEGQLSVTGESMCSKYCVCVVVVVLRPR